MGLTWTEYLSVGNALIDSDHMNLIVVINSMEHAIAKRDHAALAKAFEVFAASMHAHLRNEEKIAEAVNFPLAQNKLEHRQLMHLIEYLEPKDGIWNDELINKYSGFLSDWMLDHITKNDMQMKPVLQTYPYNLKPD